MTPGALRDWIPAALHAELDEVWAIAERMIMEPPSRFIGIWWSQELGAIEERAVAPWLGVSLFLRSDPLHGVGAFDRLRLWDEERDWNRHAVLLADLSLRFGEALAEPLGALPVGLRPRLVTDWLKEQRVDRRIPEAEASMDRGDVEGAMDALLRLWREGGDPLVAEAIDVLDERVRARPGRRFPTREARLDALTDFQHAEPDPRHATLVRAMLAGDEVPRARLGEAAAVLARMGDARLGSVPREFDAFELSAAGMWTVPLGPSARARVWELARRAGRSLGPPDAMLRALRLRAWLAPKTEQALAAAVLADALCERDHALAAMHAGEIDHIGISELPPRVREAAYDRPVGCRGEVRFRDGLVVQGECVDGDMLALDPAWRTVERLTYYGQPERLDSLASLKGLIVPMFPRDVERGAAHLARLNLHRAVPVTEMGDDVGTFALVPGVRTAIITRSSGGLPVFLRGTPVEHIAVLGSPRFLQAVRAVVPVTVRRITVVEGGTPLWAPRGWSLELDIAANALTASWIGPDVPTRGLIALLHRGDRKLAARVGTTWHTDFASVSVTVPRRALTPELRGELIAACPKITWAVCA